MTARRGDGTDPADGPRKHLATVVSARRTVVFVSNSVSTALT